MKIEAYKCDSCGLIHESQNVTGFTADQDLFDRLLSFPDVKNPIKAHFHICVSCMADKVFSPAEKQFSRRNKEKDYAKKVTELTFLIKYQIVNEFSKKRKR